MLPVQVAPLGERPCGGDKPVLVLAPGDELGRVGDDRFGLADRHEALLEAAGRDLRAVGEVDVNERGAQQRVGAASAQPVKAAQRPSRRGHAVQLVEQDDACEVRPGALAAGEARVELAEAGLESNRTGAKVVLDEITLD